MSTRLTAPVSKFTRSISTTAPIARPSHLLNATAQAGRKRHPASVASAEDAVTEASDSTRLHSTTTTSPHRPTLAARPIPLMQGFRTSAPKPARAEVPTMDAMRFPDLWALDAAAELDPYAHVRVPLLPDNASPAPGARRPEAVDAPLPRPVISVVAARPELVLPAALTEVEGMGVDGVELRFAHDLHYQGATEAEEGGAGMIRDIWKGMVEDVFGEAEKKVVA